MEGFYPARMIYSTALFGQVVLRATANPKSVLLTTRIIWVRVRHPVKVGELRIRAFFPAGRVLPTGTIKRRNSCTEFIRTESFR